MKILYAGIAGVVLLTASTSAIAQSFTFTGHAEYIGGRTNEFGDDVNGSILAQPQLVWDVGKAMAGEASQFMVGVEFQYWRNKLGTDEDEMTAQMLVVWRM